MKVFDTKISTRLWRFIPFSAVMLVLLFAAAMPGQAQLPPSPEHGFQPAGSYALSSIESINTGNGNMIVSVPLAALPPGRGGSPGFQVSLTHNSKLYDTHIEQIPEQGTGELVDQIWLNPSEQGGWHYNVSPYSLQLINRIDVEGWTQCIVGQCGTYWLRNAYIYKLKIIFPDSGEHEFRPLGYTDQLGDGYYDINPNGLAWGTSCNAGGCNVSSSQATTSGMTYYSTDGTFMRLDIPYHSSGSWTDWTLSFPDGRRIVNTGGVQRVYDRNSNFTELQSITHNGHPALKVLDQLGRSIIIEYDSAAAKDYIHLSGINGDPIKWTIKWKTIYAYKPYRATASGIHRGNTYPTTGSNEPYVVDQIILPVQAGALAYTFGYNAPDADPYPAYSYGWGEISSITLPSGAQATYAWTFDGPTVIQPPLADWVLQEAVKRKDLHYNAEYDGASTPITDTWTYSAPMNYGTVMTITGPDGGVTRNYSDSSNNNSPFARLSYKTENPDGSVVERIWQENTPYQTPDMESGVNPYVKTEFTSLKDAAGTLSQTAIKDYNYDKNGNVTQVKEYDWIAYQTVHPGGGGPTIPAAAQPKRITLNTVFNPTPDASDSSFNPGVYHQSGAAQSRNVIASSEVRDHLQAFLRTEFFYDYPTTKANLIQQKSWDSTKGGYSSTLAPANSVSVSTQYNQYGSPILSTDAKGYLTEIFYGTVGAINALYPTQIKTAFGTSVQRTETREYDFSTGLVTRSTDVDNNVSSTTAYDILGRPTLVKAAEGKPEETRATSEYSDVNRRVITRADLNTLGDGKLVSIQHYDQLGRIRLARQLEDAATQSAADETTGIKVQTRYIVVNPCQPDNTPECLSTNASTLGSYQLVSNPYRAAYSSSAGSETTMGWARSKAEKGGRVVGVQTFAGAGLPAPWAANGTSTGTVTTAYDGEFTTVTDQAGKVRRSKMDGLGRLLRVDEPNASSNLGTTSSPNQPTSYTYDALGNLRTVAQEAQTRTFTYDSLSRLQSATNPEVCNQQGVAIPVTYAYDDNGNLTSKTDARAIVSSYGYDALNRATSRSYTDGTPSVTYSYDSNITNGKGRLASVNSNVSTYSYSAYDAMGRVLGGSQTIANQTGSQTYLIGATYDLAGHVKIMTYPSGEKVNYAYDSAGRLNSFTGNLGEVNDRDYATAMTYSPLGGMTEEKYGTTTPLYNKRHYNVRGQLFENLLSTVSWATDQWHSDRGAILNWHDSQTSAPRNSNSGPDNNGNVRRAQIFAYLPDNTYAYYTDDYAYDSLNRLESINEHRGIQNVGATLQFTQAYIYDRYGNRTINAAQTSSSVNNKQFTVNTANNRLGVPGGQSGTMTYDNAGNLTTDTYSGAGLTRTFDAENRMTQENQANNFVASYGYDGDGRRVKRTTAVTGQPSSVVETWQVYGLGGELLAEYAANVAAASPKKEYGYRNGALLVTATVTAGGWGSPPAFSAPNPLVIGVTEVKAAHITELRTAIDALRSHHSLGPFPWQYSATTSDWISANPIIEMRTALDAALNPPVGGYSAGLGLGQLIKKDHIQELRDRVLNAWISGAGGVDIRWLVTDHLGTPRMIFDQSGSLANVSRHDYLPFGEELFQGAGGRTQAEGYTNSDATRQKFTSKERDIETGLDYFSARYYASTQGRFTSADPMMASAKLSNPQTMNRYVYVINNPLRYIDPDGLEGEDPWSSLTRKEQLMLAPKLTTVQDGYVPNQKQLAAAGEAFNNKVTAHDKDSGAIDLKQTTTNVASMKAFVAELGSNKQAWAQVDQIGEVSATGDGKVADVTFTAKNNEAFIGALKGDSRFRYRESDAGHADSFRLRTISAADPSFHVDRSGATFGAHWDPTSTFNLQSQERVMNGVLARDPMGAIGGLAGMGSAGIQHYGGRATVEQVQKFLTPSKQ